MCTLIITGVPYGAVAHHACNWKYVPLSFDPSAIFYLGATRLGCRWNPTLPLQYEPCGMEMIHHSRPLTGERERGCGYVCGLECARARARERKRV